MPLLFSQFCELLEDLQTISRRDPPYLPSVHRLKYKECIARWLKSYEISLFTPKVDAITLLSALFPTKRPDRVYNIQAPRLSRQLARYLGLGHGRWQHLNKYLLPGYGDLGDCVERVQKQAENPLPPRFEQVTLQQVDDALAAVARRSRFSNQTLVNKLSSSEHDPSMMLGCIYLKLQSREVKWLTRLLLKDLSSLDLLQNTAFVYSGIDARLPAALRIFDSFDSAVAELRLLPKARANGPSNESLISVFGIDGPLLSPRVGVKVGSPSWTKAIGGLNHALTLAKGKLMSLEKKYDGEYCQIHVDLGQSPNSVTIFSKSGRDATNDRQAVIPAIEESLQLKHNNRKFRKICILEGELLVWSDKDDSIMDFHKIRKHVARSGVHIGTEEDSQPQPYEHLMVFLFDILLIDDDPVLYRQQRSRKCLLEQIVTPIKGRVDLAEHVNANMSSSEGRKTLRQFLANGLGQGWEGIVMKPTVDSYFGSLEEGSTPGRWIKLKKDCIPGFGDSADMAVVGAGYEASRARDLRIPNLKFSHFFVAVLMNKNAVLHTGATPDFLVVDCVTSCISRDDFVSLNQRAMYEAMDAQNDQVSSYLHWKSVYLDPRLPKMRTVFKTPFTFDIAGSGFDKHSNRSIFTLRFPRVLKIKWDADWRQSVDLLELQNMAHEAINHSKNDMQSDIAAWEERLNGQSNGQLSPRTLLWRNENQEEASTNRDSDLSSNRSSVRSKDPRRRDYSTNAVFIRADTDEAEADQQMSSFSSVTRSHEQPALRLSRACSRSNELRCPSEGRKRRKDSAQYDYHTTLHAEGTSEEIATGEQTLPLQEMQNPPAAVDTAKLTTTTESAKPTELFPVVRKVATQPNIPLYPRVKRRRHYSNASKQSQRTTSDENSSPASSQIRSLFATASQPVPSRAQIFPQKINIPKAQNPATSFYVQQLPDLGKSMILMEKNRRPLSARFSRFYRANRAVLRPVLQSLRVLDRLPMQTSNSLGDCINVLVDSTHREAATQDLTTICAKATLLQGVRILIWDWRVLEMMVDRSKGVSVSAKRLQGFFVAEVIYGSDGITNETGVVKVKWRGGEIDDMSSETSFAVTGITGR